MFIDEMYMWKDSASHGFLPIEARIRYSSIAIPVVVVFNFKTNRNLIMCTNISTCFNC